MTGLELSERYFEIVGLPMLSQELGEDVQRVAVGLVGDGSECFGFDDAISQDHDWGPGFCIWLSQEHYEVVGGRLQEAFDRLPRAFAGYGPRRTSAWGERRVGVFEIRSFYQRFLGLDHIPMHPEEWLILPENSLAACTNGKVFWDPRGEFSGWRDALVAYYPEDVRRKKLASRCMTIGQAGQYNFPRCIRRGDVFSAGYAEIKFCADVMSLVFLLNRKYAPFYKWMHRAVGGLPLLGPWVSARITDLIMEPDSGQKAERIEEITGELIQELVRQQLTDAKSAFLPDHGPAIQRGIQEQRLRERNVWVG
jgi:Domain of unknown function (DUF4037)